MATDELVLDSVEASTPEPETVATDEVVQEESTQVAEEATKPESVAYDDFVALQKKYETRQTELLKEVETLKAKQPTVEAGPKPEETRRFNDLNNQHQYLLQQIEAAETAEEATAISYQLGALERSLVDAHATLIAREVGIDPNDSTFRESLLTETVESAKDLERLAWKVKATKTEEYKMSESLAKREAELEKAEKSIEDRIADGIKLATASLREELGLNATTSVKPAGSSGDRAKLEKEISDAMARGDWQGALDARSILAQLAE